MNSAQKGRRMAAVDSPKQTAPCPPAHAKSRRENRHLNRLMSLSPRQFHTKLAKKKILIIFELDSPSKKFKIFINFLNGL